MPGSVPASSVTTAPHVLPPSSLWQKLRLLGIGVLAPPVVAEGSVKPLLVPRERDAVQEAVAVLIELIRLDDVKLDAGEHRDVGGLPEKDALRPRGGSAARRCSALCGASSRATRARPYFIASFTSGGAPRESGEVRKRSLSISWPAAAAPRAGWSPRS